MQAFVSGTWIDDASDVYTLVAIVAALSSAVVLIVWRRWVRRGRGDDR